ncbi:MAG: helix-turn-helix domain-containing protein [Roseburia lenta]|nr:helix-turn-helix domain-containing protein [Roseburia lenta]
MLAENLIMLRNLKGMTQEQIAEVIGISRQAYAKWESGETVPDIAKCDRLAGFYQIKMDDLMHYNEKVGDVRLAPPPEGKFLWGTVKVGNRGTIVVPKEARDTYGLKEGDRLVVLGDGEGIALVSAQKFEQRLRETMELSRKIVEE